MNKKFKHRLVLSAMSTGAFMLSLFAGQAAAETAVCGQAKLVESGSHSVSVSNSGCSETNRISIGSVLELAGGSRMWLKLDSSASGEAVQLICQNKAAEAVKVNFTATSEPWIKAEGVKDCNKWKNNKLSCESESGEKNSFFCAIAKARPVSSDGSPVLTTSVKMRTILPVPAPVLAEEVIKNIQPEIELCKTLYNVTDKVEMSWTVSYGKIQDLAVNSSNQDFKNCVEEVVKEVNKDQDLSIKHAF